MSENPEDVAKELEDTGSEVDDSVLEDVSGGGLSEADADTNINNNGGARAEVYFDLSHFLQKKRKFFRLP